MDDSIAVRGDETLDLVALTGYLRQHIEGFQEILQIRQFPGGFSNLTYLLITNLGEWVLRTPPKGVNIQTAHDMGREFRILTQLSGIFGRIPRPVHYCSGEEVIGRPFFIMEHVNGLILRNKIPTGMNLAPYVMHAISSSVVDNLALMHQIDIQTTGLHELGKVQGYIERQLSGWIKRYRNAQTDDSPSMDGLITWMETHHPDDAFPGLIHNDYKYDNLVLDSAEPARILAVLDWEMATVGDTRMDLGTTLAYWTEAKEAETMQLAAGNLTWLPGNLTRAEVVERYTLTTGHDIGDVLFFFVFGTFKIAVIIQQIYSRWRKGLTSDARFGQLIHGVHYFERLGTAALDKGRISQLVI